MTEAKPRLKKAETVDEAWAVATYDVMIGDNRIGGITKHIEEVLRLQKNGRTRKRNDVYWSWDDRDGCNDHEAYQLKSEAIDRVVAEFKKRSP